jgi:hypothetical protein
LEHGDLGALFATVLNGSIAAIKRSIAGSVLWTRAIGALASAGKCWHDYEHKVARVDLDG